MISTLLQLALLLSSALKLKLGFLLGLGFMISGIWHTLFGLQSLDLAEVTLGHHCGSLLPFGEISGIPQLKNTKKSQKIQQILLCPVFGSICGLLFPYEEISGMHH